MNSGQCNFQDSQHPFNLGDTVEGIMTPGTEIPQAPDHPDPLGTTTQYLSFKAVIVRNDSEIVFRVTEVDDSDDHQIEQVRERGMQVIEVGQIFSIYELTGWDIHVIEKTQPDNQLSAVKIAC
ncbi:MAG: hypothetical protein VKJ02_03445 [Snowella sp.]|nr:hypothetical protein [Snowella sp.]